MNTIWTCQSAQKHHWYISTVELIKTYFNETIGGVVYLKTLERKFYGGTI